MSQMQVGAGLPLRIAQGMAGVACDLLLQEVAIVDADYGQVFASMEREIRK
jgi:hypothetical protein